PHLVEVPKPAPGDGPYRLRAAPDPGDAVSPFRAAPARPPCPRCGAPLDDGAAHGESVHTCDGCGGAFFDHGALARLVDASRPDDGPSPRSRPLPTGTIDPEVRYLRCPVCASTMNRMNFGRRSGILVDTCRAHGTWLDAGELDRILAFVAAGGLG